jgi:hypothetical protein
MIGIFILAVVKPSLGTPSFSHTIGNFPQPISP